MPVVTVLGLQLATLLIGAVVVERVFVIPGLGSLLLDGVANRDLIVVQDVVMLLVVAVLVVNFVVDLLYLALDPRLRGRCAVSAPRRLELDPGAGRRSGRRLNPSLVVGGLLVLLVVAMALVSFVWTPYDPTLVDPTSRLLDALGAALARHRQVRPRRPQPDHGRARGRRCSSGSSRWAWPP